MSLTIKETTFSDPSIEKEDLPFVSIIIPVRNEENLIRQCLAAILDQDYPTTNYEVIMINDHSTDKTVEVIHGFMNACMYKDQIILVNNEGKGVGEARRTGVKYSKGSVIINYSAHVIATRNYISTLVMKLTNLGKDVAGVGCLFKRLDDSNPMARNITLAMTSAFGGYGTSHYQSRKEGFVEAVTFAAIKKEAIEKIGGYPAGDDSELNILLRKFGYKLYNTTETYVYYKFIRARIWDFVIRMIDYGRSRASDIKRHPSSFKFIYITPSFFTLLLLLLSTIVFILPKYPFSIIICGIAGIYLLVDFIASVHIGLKNNFKGFYWLIILYPLIHIGYGLGFLIGLLPRKKRLVKKRE